MARFIERRTSRPPTATIIAIMFAIAVLVAIVSGGVPTWQRHGANAGPGLAWRTDDARLYYTLTLAYAGIAAVAAILAFFRLPRITLAPIRWLFATVFLLLFCFLFYNLTKLGSNERSQTAWKRIEELGGHGV